MRRAAARLLTLAAIGTLLGACSDPANQSADRHHAQGADLVPTAGGSVTMAVDAVPTTLNDHTPAGNTAAGRAVASMVWGQVFQLAPGPAPKLDTAVIDSAEVVSVNPQTVVYQIDPKAVWSDGVPVTAQDFVYAWLSQQGTGQDVDGRPDAVATTAGYRDIGSVVGSNAGKTVTVTFATPYSDWASLFDDLLPAHVVEKVGWNHGLDTFDSSRLVSAGPWVVSAWTPGQSITLTKNPKWWGQPPRLDQVRLKVLTGAALVSALRSGAVQVAAPSAFDTSFAAAVSSSPTLESALSLGTTTLSLVFNVHRSAVASASARQGIAHAIDRVGIVQQAAQPLSRLVWEDNNHLFANGQPWYADNASGYAEPDPDSTTRLVAAGGLLADTNGTWRSLGSPVTLSVVWASDDPWSAVAGPAVCASLVSAGFDVTAAPVPSATLFGSVLPGGAFDLAIAPLTMQPYPSAMATVYSTQSAVNGVGAGLDWSGFDDTKVDALFTQTSGQLAAQLDQGLYQQIDALLWTDMPVLPLFAEPTMAVWSTGLDGVQDDPGGLGPIWSVDQWVHVVPKTSMSPTAQRAAGAKLPKR